MDDAVLETQRLVLRQLRDGDVALQMEVLNTPTVMAHLGGVKSAEEIRAKHDKGRAMFAKDGFSFMMMIEKATGDLVGHAGMKRVDHPDAPNTGDHEIGWLVREDRWRRGYAEEAIRAVINWAFTDIGAPHLVALTSPENEGSWRLMEKLVMQRREDLDFLDRTDPSDPHLLIQYSLTPDQWEQNQ